jgi:signal transduction histidine kinase/streptogramin lyase
LESGKFIAYHTAQGLVGQNGLSICEDPSGQLWVATEDALNRLRDDRFEVVLQEERLRNSQLRAVYADRDRSIWVATIGAGLFQLHGGQAHCLTSHDGLPDNKVRNVLQDRDGNLWIGTWSGLCRRKERALDTLTRQDGLPHDHIESLFEDNEGSLWIGTRGGGLARLRDGKFSNYTTREGLAHNFAKCVLEDRAGALWFGTHGGGLSRYQNGTFTNFSTEHGLASPFVWAVEQDRAGHLWVGTARPAVLHLFKDGTFASYGKQQGLLVRGGIRALCADKDGNLWMGGDGGGLCRFRDGAFTGYTARDGSPNTLIRVIYQDRAGDLWIATKDGLCRYRQDKFTCYTTADGLAHNSVYTIFEDSAGSIWFGTQAGVSRLSDGRFRSYTAHEGLFQNVIYRIIEDDRENFWMSSDRGIFTVERQRFLDFDQGKLRSLPCVSYGLADGMKAVQCEGGNQPAGARSRDGKLWFPTASGVTMVDPPRIARNLRPPPVFIEQVRIGKQLLNPRVSVRLPPGEREFTFYYTALSFVAPEKIRFKYKLEGLDEQWVDAETRRLAFYNEIPPGAYRFHVIACNSDGVWNETGATFAFSLAPHFYQTAWFYALGALAIVIGGWSFHRHRMRRAQSEFALVLAERTRIARDLHDTLAQGFAGIAFQLEAVATKLAAAPAQAQQHLHLALQMVRHSLTEARRSVMNLRSAALDTGDLSNALAETARQMAADKPVDVQLKISGMARPLPSKIENDLLHIGQEAITNSLKYSRATRIQVELDFAPATVRLRVRDDGQGFNPEQTAGHEQTHFGLLGMRERAKQMGATLSIRSQPGQGTEIVVEVALSGR